jgi:hypothetical protein
MLRALQERAVSLWHEKQVNLTWRPDVVEWLTSKVSVGKPMLARRKTYIIPTEGIGVLHVWLL